MCGIFCVNCGRCKGENKVVTILNCTNCGAPVNLGELKCSKCGAYQPLPPAPPGEDTKRQKVGIDEI